MSSDTVKAYLETKARELSDFTEEDRDEAVSFLLAALKILPEKEAREDNEITKALNPTFDASATWGESRVVSVKPSNYFISWSKMGVLVGKGAAAIAASKGLALLGVLAGGSVHFYDEYDSAIIRVIHRYQGQLPMPTERFFDLFHSDFPPSINKSMFMCRMKSLADCGAILIDGDKLNVSEVLYQFWKPTPKA